MTLHLQELERLNHLYIECVVNSDADTFATILADDFVCSTPDGTLLSRQEFLEKTAASPRLKSMDIDDVRIRILGDVAIIHARTRYGTASGAAGSGRYTDIWAKREGRWLAVAAHVTRLV